MKQEAYRDLNAWVPFNDMSTVSFSTPPGDAQHGPFAFVVPEQGLEFDLPVTYQGISAILHMDLHNICLVKQQAVQFPSYQ